MKKKKPTVRAKVQDRKKKTLLTKRDTKTHKPKKRVKITVSKGSVRPLRTVLSSSEKSVMRSTEMKSFDFNPLSGTLAPIPDISPELCIDELFSWLTAKPQSYLFYYAEHTRDYLKEQEEFPPRVPAYVLPGEKAEPDKYKYEFFKSIDSFDNVNFKYSTGFHFLKGILTSVRAYPKTFTDKWAEYMQIATYADNLGLSIELRCIDDVIERLKGKLTNKQDLIPNLFHNRHHGRLMAHDCRASSLDEKTGDTIFEFGFGMLTAKKFRAELVHILNGRRKLLSSLQPTDQAKSRPIVTVASSSTHVPALGYLHKKDNAPDITRFAMAQLLFELRENQMIYRGMSNADLGKIIHYLIGVEPEKMRKNLSDPEFQPKVKLPAKEADYLLRKLRSIVTSIESRREDK